MRKVKIDYPLLIAVGIMVAVGLVFVYSASCSVALKTYKDAYFFLKKQLVGVAIGAVCFIFFTFFDYNKIKKYAPFILIVSYILLILVFVPGISKESYGAKRWIRLGGFTLQPSEFAKFAYIVFFASYAAKKPQKICSFKGILPPLILGAIYCVLIILEPNMSITVCFAALIFVLLYLSGTKKKNLLYLILPAVCAVPLLILAEPYRLKRLSAFLDPWASPKGEGYQLLQSLYAIGSGGWFGVGLFQSRQKEQFLPFAESDFILSIIAEETGFIGCICLFVLIAFIVWRCVYIAKRSKNYFGYLLACGIAAIFALQCVINALVVTGTIPPTGLPLPLISSGNTAIIVFLSEFGIVLNISAQAEKV